MPDAVRYTIQLDRRALRTLSRFPQDVQRRIRERIDELASNPRPHGVEPIAGEPGTFRIRVGSYRVVYLIDDKARTIVIDRIAHRKDVYR